MNELIGILGTGRVSDKLVSALLQVESKRPCSAGIAVMNTSRVALRRTAGPPAELKALLDVAPVIGSIGMAQVTRHQWMPDEAQIGPQQVGRTTAIVMGQVSTHRKQVHISETVAGLCDRELEMSRAPEEAVSNALCDMRGAFCAVFMFRGMPDLLIAAHRGVQLSLGVKGPFVRNAGGPYVVSGPTLATIPGANALHLGAGTIAVLTRRTVRILGGEQGETVRTVETTTPTNPPNVSIAG